ncbi:MAG: nitrilase-related carbon-nitrogen hydrolase, partial [Acidobacteriota bacterium]
MSGVAAGSTVRSTLGKNRSAVQFHAIVNLVAEEERVRGSQPFRVAAVQASPVFLDLEATLEKTCGLIREAAAEGASLVAFPESYLAGYPVWVWFVPPGHTHPLREVYARLHASSIAIPGPATDRLGEVAADCGVAVAIGANERNAEGSDST